MEETPDSPEYTTVNNMKKEFRIAFTKNTLDLATSFQKAKIVDDTCYDIVSQVRSSLIPTEKAEAISADVIRSVKDSPAAFHTMMRILKVHIKFYGPLIKRLEEEYAKNVAIATKNTTGEDQSESNQVKVAKGATAGDTSKTVTGDGGILTKPKGSFGQMSSISPPECYSEESIEAMDRGSHMPLLKLGSGDETTHLHIKEQVYIPSSEIVDYYDMTAKKHGVCFIINNIVFKKLSDRLGAERDEYNLIQTWRYMGYRVEVRRNVTAAMMKKIFEEMEHTLENIKQEDPDLAHDSFVCCILSHGGKHSIYGYDGEAVEDTEIEKALGKCKTLINRPKILFIQACQGGGFGAEVVESDAEPKRIQYQSDDVQNERADIYKSNAAAYGDKAYRDKVKGSIYIQVLCQVLCEDSKKGTLNDLHIAINSKVSKIVVGIDKGIKHYQQCGPHHTLHAKVHFFLHKK